MTREEAIDKVYGMTGTAEQHEALDFLVPEIRELRESYDRQQKDEKIRKEIISALKFANVGGVYDKHIAYLEKQKEQKSINLHDKIEELCSKYPINKYSMSDKELSAYHQGVHLGATKIAEYLSEQRSIELSEEEIIKTIKTEISQFGTTAYENYTHDSSDKEYWTYMTCKKITNLINSLCNGN